MNLPVQSCLKLALAAFFTATVAGRADEPAAGSPGVKSVFIMPASPKQGRDPFYPDSTRPYKKAGGTVKQTAELTSLKLIGISGTPEHRLVIINKNTFAEGDEQDVLVPGGRIRVRCLQIKPNSVLIEVAGHSQELNFLNNQ